MLAKMTDKALSELISTHEGRNQYRKEAAECYENILRNLSNFENKEESGSLIKVPGLKIFRRICILFRRKRFYKEVSAKGFILYFDYLENKKFVYLKDVAIYLGFDSLSTALKSDVFQKTLSESGLDLNSLCYGYE